jgi:hypothetical protein
MGGKSSPPPAPDYTAAAEKTAQGNLDMARLTTKANRVDTFTPLGSLTYQQGGTFNQAGYDAAMAKYESDMAAYNAAVANGTGMNGNLTDAGGSGWDPDGAAGGGGAAGGMIAPTAVNRDDFMEGDPDKWTSTVSLTPEQQKLFDTQQATSLGLSELQGTGVDRVKESMSTPFSLGGAPAAGTAYQAMDLPETYDPNKGPELSEYYNPTRDTNKATQHIMSRLTPQMEREDESIRTMLSNQGLTPGSEAYNRELELMGNRHNDMSVQAALQGIDLGMRQQGQNFNQSATGIGVDMAQQAQQFGQGTQNIKSNMAQQGQSFAQQNATRQNAVQEMMLERSQPLNELNALRTGSQVSMPTFQQAPQQTNVAGANYSGAARDQYSGAMDAFGVGQAQDQSTMSGLGSMAGAAALMFF